MIQYMYTGKYTYALEPSACLHNSGFAGLKDSLGASTEDAKGNAERYVAALSAQIRLIDIADKYLIAQLASKAADEFRLIISVHKTTQFLTFLDIVPLVYALESESAILLRKECVAASKACFGPKLAVGTRHRKRLDKALAATPEFSKEVLGTFLAVKRPLNKKQKVAVGAD